MSLLTPERVPVYVYRHDDVGAPQLDKTPGCMMTIYKACLFTGYGTKAGAGWTMPYEDTVAKVKVFRPPASPNTDFYLRCSADTGTQMTAQVYLNMTAQNKGSLKLQLAKSFKYAKSNSTGKWLLIASPRGLWFFAEQSHQGDQNKTGCFFYCGDVNSLADSESCIYMKHSSSQYDDGYYSDVFHTSSTDWPSGVIYNPASNVVSNVNPIPTLFDGKQAYASSRILAPAYIMYNNRIYGLPGAFTHAAGADGVNFETFTGVLAIPQDLIIFGTSGFENSNFCVATEFWE